MNVVRWAPSIQSRYRTPEATFSLFGIAPWLAVAYLLPLLAGTIRGTELVLGIIHLIGAWALGALVIRRVPTMRETPDFVRSGVALLVGSFLMYFFGVMAFSGGDRRLLLGIAAILAVAAAIFRRVIQPLRMERAGLAAVAIAMLATTTLSIWNGDLSRALTRFPTPLGIDDDVDAPFFTSLVATMRHGTIRTAVYEHGSPLGYAVLGAVNPASFAAATGIPAHVALWGVWMPIFKVLGLIVLAEVVRRLVGRDEKPTVVAAVSPILLFLLLQPLHPLYVLKGDTENFVWGGIGFISGGLNLPTTAGIVWIAFALAIAFPHPPGCRLAKHDIALLALAIAILSAVKITMFVSAVAALSVIAVWRLARGDRSLAMAIAMAMPLTAVVYAWSYAGGRHQLVFEFGYLPTYFTKVSGLQVEGAAGIAIGIVIGAVLMIVWGGIRLLAAAALACSPDQGDRVRLRREFILATFAALVAGVLVASVFSVRVDGIATKLEGDQNFNLAQFPRAAFLLVSIAGVAGVIVWFRVRQHRRWKVVVASAVVSAWCIVSMIPLLRGAVSPPVVVDEWLVGARNELLSAPPELAAMNPIARRGMYLIASETGRFWVSQNYLNMTVVNSYRWSVFANVLSDDVEKRASACRTLVKENVDAIVAAPNEVGAVKRFASECSFARSGEHQWVWRRSADITR